ncbi:unnamed protein product [Schistosoma rodhaini]|uniref:J domain-containing protein n=1 Tax=Schistosoma rodhaini TaxID=6188 RepID=A0AA85EL23_9TREM|nr:unnamed protein product [Schistosoma rodhaini]
MFLFRTSGTSNQSTSILNISRHFSIKLAHAAIKAFELLGISTSSTPEECRKAYLNLARRIHPDVKNELADTSDDNNSNNNNINNDFQKRTNVEFHQLHEAYTLAYEICLKNNNESSNGCIHEQLNNDIQEFRHKAPQHRRFLDLGRHEQHLDGLQQCVNSGRLNEHRKYVQSQRVVKALQGAADCRVKKLMKSVNYDDNDSQRDCNKLIPKRLSVSKRNTELNTPVYVDYISRTAEEQIQRAMNHGEFNNLPGQGRPIDYDKNPHVFGDSTDKRLNQLMANQGFLPKWVLLNKEVNSRWNIAIDKLNSIYNVESNLHSSIWAEACKDFEVEVKELNRLLDQYNLLVPSHQMQRFHLNSKTAVDQVIKAKQSHANDQNKRDPTTTQNENKDDVPQTEDNSQSLWDPRYMAEVMRDFYRELAKAWASILRGFKDHK